MDVKTECQLLKELKGAVENDAPSWVSSVSVDLYRKSRGGNELRIYFHWDQKGVPGSSHTPFIGALGLEVFCVGLSEAIEEANKSAQTGREIEITDDMQRDISDAFTDAGSAPEPPFEYEFAIECAEEREKRAEQLLEEAQKYYATGCDDLVDTVSREANALIELAANDRAWAEKRREVSQ